MITHVWKEGDRVIWKSYFAAGQAPLLIPAIVKGITLHRVIIDALLPSDGEKLRVTRRVSPKYLSARTQYFSELDG